ncbi:hypothetical protein B0T22DRAFT_262804 [Podospora appendiculata]|uniref:Uncharacterized protein n=1 Tax=Podospora appendiculata TaxID=314037 RepID=A0AAE1C991_9PEZI|nr:hypothetical protein B0T22DRAFT_262804 [Podospora appendiculata]
MVVSAQGPSCTLTAILTIIFLTTLSTRGKLLAFFVKTACEQEQVSIENTPLSRSFGSVSQPIAWQAFVSEFTPGTCASMHACTCQETSAAWPGYWFCSVVIREYFFRVSQVCGSHPLFLSLSQHHSLPPSKAYLNS